MVPERRKKRADPLHLLDVEDPPGRKRLQKKQQRPQRLPVEGDQQNKMLPKNPRLKLKAEDPFLQGERL
jgi:hypothetical protein